MQVCVKELSFSYGQRKILDSLSFEVSRGEVLGILGINGAGKSTLLKLLCGLMPIQKGTIESVPRDRLGVVFQECSLDLKLTGFENLKLFAALFGCKLKSDFALPGVDLRQPVKNLSGGMKRRLELARVFVHEPELVLMDEPTTGLDLKACDDFWTDVRSKKTTVILNTHKAEEAERCDRLLILHQGRVLLSESPGVFKARVTEDRVILKLKDQSTQEISTLEGHKMVPRLVESYPAGSIESVEVKTPSLADAFMKVTGVSLT